MVKKLDRYKNNLKVLDNAGLNPIAVFKDKYIRVSAQGVLSEYILSNLGERLFKRNLINLLEDIKYNMIKMIDSKIEKI